jgi:1-phosphatidylinositol-4-phosphate 5-kinase
MLNEPFVSYTTNSKGAGRTGGVFFFTQNGHYIVKTIKREEMQTLWNMLPRYTAYLKSRSGNASLLTRFLGLYKLEWTENDKNNKDTSACYYVVIMNAVFPVGVSRHFSEMFDLKGSTVGRETSKEQRERRQKVIMMKDLDLMPDYGKEIHNRHDVVDDDDPLRGPLQIGPTAKSALLVQLQRDVQFLEQSAVIDYSLLVGILTPKSRKNPIAIVHRRTWTQQCLAFLTAPFQAVMAPAIFLHSIKGFGHIPISWPPLVPYYGSLQGGIDMGPLSCIGGERSGMPAIYFLGLIDFLQPYNYKKVLEYRAKSLVYEKDTFSCVPPTTYANRFLAFIDRCVS